MKNEEYDEIFDGPPHLVHVTVAEKILRKLTVEQIIESEFFDVSITDRLKQFLPKKKPALTPASTDHLDLPNKMQVLLAYVWLFPTVKQHGTKASMLSS